jgi:hypothetical protein
LALRHRSRQTNDELGGVRNVAQQRVLGPGQIVLRQLTDRLEQTGAKFIV